MTRQKPTNVARSSKSERAQDTAIQQHNVITLTARDSATFAEAVLNPGTPNANLQSAFARYRADVLDEDEVANGEKR
ncbi:MAG: hypothetical protein OHK0022_01150 [Roseiflexaceae bacterium]